MTSRGPGLTRPLELTAFRAVLGLLGVLMRAASHRSPRFRRQVTRDVVVEIASGDGVSRQFVFEAASRTMRSSARQRRRPDVELRFATARDGLRALLSPRAVGRIIEGATYGETRLDGNVQLVLWFYGLTRVVLPIGRSSRPRRAIPVPVRGQETTAPYAARIVREPAVEGLDPEWTAAWTARARTHQLRVGAGEPVPRG